MPFYGSRKKSPICKGKIHKGCINHGSPHGMKEHVGSIVHCVVEAAQHAGAAAEVLSLIDIFVQPRKGYWVCPKTSQCLMNDDLSYIISFITGFNPKSHNL